MIVASAGEKVKLRGLSRKDVDSMITVIRPSDPGKALLRASEILALALDERERAFQSMLHEQPYTVMGYLAGNHIVDSNGKIVGKIEPGDSFVTIGG